MPPATNQSRGMASKETAMAWQAMAWDAKQWQGKAINGLASQAMARLTKPLCHHSASLYGGLCPSHQQRITNSILDFSCCSQLDGWPVAKRKNLAASKSASLV